MTECVRVSRIVEDYHMIRIDPPVPGLQSTYRERGFDAAVGFAVGIAAALNRWVIDDTGRLSRETCQQLVAAYCLDEMLALRGAGPGAPPVA